MNRIIQSIRRWHAANQVKKGRKILFSINQHMKHAGMKRWEVRQFWRDFQKSNEFREDLLERMKR